MPCQPCALDCNIDPDSGIALPLWHCPFRDCCFCWHSTDVATNHEKAWWQHVWQTASHKTICLRSLREAGMAVSTHELPETVFAVLIAAMTEQERRSLYMVPQVGISIDRRTLVHLGETFDEENTKCLMCFVCGCKYLYHHGYNKFGEPVDKGDIDYHQDIDRVLSRLLHGDEKDSFGRAWEFNMSRKRFKDRFGEAVQTDDSFANDTWEWRRVTRRNGANEEVMCNPEDVLRSLQCRHDEHSVCSKCRIPFCRECRRLTAQNQKIPKALTNDNFIGYMNRYFVDHEVTWLEATIASPVFTGLVTYYIEGAQEHRHHLMEETITQPQRAYGVRGSLFSFLLPWEQIQRDVRRTVMEGDLSEWPLSPAQVGRVLRVRFMRGPVEIINKFKELSVRAKVLKDVAHMFISNHCKDLVDRPGVLVLHAVHKKPTVLESLHNHVEERVDELYPGEIYTDSHGAIPPALHAMMLSQASAEKDKTNAASSESAYEMKQSTMPDAVDEADKVFSYARPTIVVGEATTSDALDKNTAVEHALGNVSGLTLEMSNEFENQFVSKYMPRIFPWALNYDCGGADYPDLFTRYDDNDPDSRAAAVKTVWRRVADEAMVTPGIYKEMLATRPEKQLAGDWLLVPAAQNLHWRWMVLKSAFLTCKQKVKPGDTSTQNLEALIEAAKTLWTRMKSGKVVVDGRARPMNGEVALLFRDDTLNSTERVLLRSYFNTTNNIAGCQALRKKIGHILFGMRIVYGPNPVFVTVSPNRRHSGLLYKLQRLRRNDTGVTGADGISQQRRKWSGPDDPPVFVRGFVTSPEELSIKRQDFHQTTRLPSND